MPYPGEIEEKIKKGGRRAGETEEDVAKREEYYSQPDWATPPYRKGYERHRGDFYAPTGPQAGEPISYTPDRAAVDRPLTPGDEFSAAPIDDDSTTNLKVNFNNAPEGMRARTSNADDGLDVSISRQSQVLM